MGAKIKKLRKMIYNKAITIKLKIIGISICLCLVIIFKLYVPISAEVNKFDTYYEIGAGKNTYYFSELLTKYRTNSVTYKRSILDYQIQALNSNLADKNHANIGLQYVDLLNKINELNQTKEALISYKNDLMPHKSQVVTGSAITKEITTSIDNQELIKEIDIQIANIDSQLLQYNTTKSSLEINLSDAQLSMNISKFYWTYQSLIENEAKKKMENEFLKQCYSLIILQEQKDYYKVYSDYLALIKEADVIRYGYGLVTETELNVDEVNILHNKIAISDNKNDFEAEINAIKRDTGIEDKTKIKLHLLANKKEYDLDTVTQRFINSNSGYQQIQNYIRSYQEYINTDKISGYTSYYQTELRIDYYRLQREELEDNIRSYVAQAINSYKKAIRFRDASWKELQIKNNQYIVMVTKLKNKRASDIEVAKSLCDKEAAEVTYYQSCYESIIWQNIIDNQIYGAMP